MNIGRKFLNLSLFEFEPAHFIMERKMLLRLKELAEREECEEKLSESEARLQNRLAA